MTLIPPSEDPEVALFFLNHNQHPDRAPAGHGLFTFYYEMAAASARADDPDAVLVERACQPVFSLFPELRGTVDFAHVHRWRLGLPHVKVGAFAEIARFVDTLPGASPIRFARDYMSETGMNTAVAHGRRAADSTARHLRRGWP
jgi:oxygen-dependent protoporphyrinogen oxidase